MRKPRRKKVLLLLLIFILLIATLGYIFRYPLIQKFQYARLSSLTCTPKAGDCMHRLWVHRVNSIERYDLLKDQYYGFETDIVYDSSSRSFSVYHPPLTVADDTLSLVRFLKNTDFSNHSIWFDTRGVDTFNMKEALEVLNTTGIKNQAIIELYDLRAAKLFALDGYYVAFNVSEALQMEMLAHKAIKDSINAELREIMYVSQDVNHLPFIKKLFPEKSIITWQTEFKVFFNMDALQKLLDDPQIDIILVNIKSRYYK